MEIRIEVIRAFSDRRGYELLYSGYDISEGKRIYDEGMVMGNGFIQLMRAYYLDDGSLSSIDVILPGASPLVEIEGDL